jgi:hypothetical protein
MEAVMSEAPGVFPPPSKERQAQLDRALEQQSDEVQRLALTLAHAVNSREEVLLEVDDEVSGQKRYFMVSAKEVPAPVEGNTQQLELLESGRA